MGQIPVEVTVAIWIVIAGALSSLFIRQSQHESRIKVSEANVNNTKDNMESLMVKVDEGFRNLNEKLDRVEYRMDIFIKNEIDSLKDIVKRHG